MMMLEMLRRGMYAIAPVGGGNGVGARGGGPLTGAVGRGSEIMVERGSAAVAHHGAGRRRFVATGAAETATGSVTMVRRRSRDARGAVVALRQRRRTSFGRRRRGFRGKFGFHGGISVAAADSSLRHGGHLHSRWQSRVHEGFRPSDHSVRIGLRISIVAGIVVVRIGVVVIRVSVHASKVK